MRSSASNVVSTITAGGCGCARSRPGRRDAVEPRHPDVHQHHVGAMAVDSRQHLVAVAGLRRRPRRRSSGASINRRPERSSGSSSTSSDAALRSRRSRAGLRAARSDPAPSGPFSSSPPASSTRSAKPDESGARTRWTALSWVRRTAAHELYDQRRRARRFDRLRPTRSSPPCLRALVSPSWTVRYAVRPIELGDVRAPTSSR